MTAEAGEARECSASWRPVLRDVVVVVVLFFVAFQLFAQAEGHEPDFTAADIHVVEGTVAAYTTVRVPETAAAPQINTDTLVGRTAMRLEGRPPNVLSYIHGSPWQIDNDIPVGTVVRLEVVEDPNALSARARAYPDGEFLQPIEGLQVGERVYFRAIDEVTRAEEAVRRFRNLGIAALLTALAWLGGVVWSRWSDIRHAITVAQGF